MSVKRNLLSVGIIVGTFSAIGFASASTWSNLPVDGSGNVIVEPTGTLSGALDVSKPNASGTWTYAFSNDGNYLEVNTTGTIPGTNPVPYSILLQNCPPVSTTSTQVTSSSWECALSQAENFPDGSRSFVDWDTEYYPTGTGANVASGWFDNKRGTSSVEFPFELSWNDGSVNHVGFSMTPATNTSASNFNTLLNNGTGYFTVGTASSTTGAFDVFQNGGNTCAGIYDAGANVIYGLTDSLPAPSGCVALGGYYHGLGIGGSTANAGSPIFGVLNSSQSSNGKGHTAFTVYDTNEVDTYNNTLDDGTGNAIVSSTLTAKNIKITSITSSLLATDANGNIIATTTAGGGGGGGVASTTPFTTDAPVTVSSSGALSTYPNNPVPFYTYGVQYSQTTAAPQGVTTSVTLWGPFYWGAAAQCSSLTYDITTGGGAGSWVDFGIYDVNGNLLADTGPQTLNTTGIKNYSFTQGREIITPQDVFVGIGVTSSSARFAAWAANYGWMQAGKGASLANASATLPSVTTFPASSTVNNTVVPSFSCSY